MDTFVLDLLISLEKVKVYTILFSLSKYENNDKTVLKYFH